MDTVLKSVDREPQQQAPTFETQIGDENFDFLAVAFDDAKVTGGQLCMAVARLKIRAFCGISGRANWKRSAPPRPLISIRTRSAASSSSRAATRTASSSRDWRWNGRTRS